jgi:sterol desaturase/sphingolipid hydroxylase (fatty acid hydroxylase superfamily)
MTPLIAYGAPLVAIAVASLFERLAPAHPAGRSEWGFNLSALALTNLIQISAGLLIATTETRLINRMGGGVIDLSSAPWIVGALAYFVVMDLGEYLFHRAQHAFPFLWAMHSMHHSDRAFNATTTVRHFWLEPVIKALTIWLAPAILTFYFVVGLNNVLAHANLRLGFGPFSWLWNTAQYHRLHHSSDPRYFNANFAAILPIFDVLTGAYRRPRPGEFPDTGLDESAGGPLNVLIWPLRGVIRGRLAAAARATD